MKRNGSLPPSPQHDGDRAFEAAWGRGRQSVIGRRTHWQEPKHPNDPTKEFDHER